MYIMSQFADVEDIGVRQAQVVTACHGNAQYQWAQQLDYVLIRNHKHCLVLRDQFRQFIKKKRQDPFVEGLEMFPFGHVSGIVIQGIFVYPGVQQRGYADHVYQTSSPLTMCLFSLAECGKRRADCAAKPIDFIAGRFTMPDQVQAFPLSLIYFFLPHDAIFLSLGQIHRIALALPSPLQETEIYKLILIYPNWLIFKSKLIASNRFLGSPYKTVQINNFNQLHIIASGNTW